MRPGAVVVITGASSGIGAATARAFAAHGSRLVLGARREALLQTLAERLQRECGVQVLDQRCDVHSTADVNALIDATVARFGRIDVLVANAGIGYYGRVEDADEADLRELLETNVVGVHRAVRAAVPIMRRQRQGHIAIVGSVSGKLSWPLHGPYAASKFALVGLAQALRAELSGAGVSVSLILPGSTRTPFFASARVGLAGYEPKPLGIVQSAEAVAAAIVRSVDHPAPEVDTVRWLRPAFVLAEAFPQLADLAARLYYSRLAKKLSAQSTSTRDEVAATASGTPQRNA